MIIYHFLESIFSFLVYLIVLLIKTPLKRYLTPKRHFSYTLLPHPILPYGHSSLCRRLWLVLIPLIHAVWLPIFHTSQTGRLACSCLILQPLTQWPHIRPSVTICWMSEWICRRKGVRHFLWTPACIKARHMVCSGMVRTSIGLQHRKLMGEETG